MNARLDVLLSHPLLWRARDTAVQVDALPTGLTSLDEYLPGGGWPTQGLIEILSEQVDNEALCLFAPLLATVFAHSSMRKGGGDTLAWITPPHEPYPPALTASGIDIKRILVVRTEQTLWAMEQILRSAACRVVLAWINNASIKNLRRLQLAAKGSASLSILMRSVRYSAQPSPAVLRLRVEREAAHLKVSIVKSRGGRLGSILIPDKRTA
jgi:cell division inhibitor SulA/protein ImuA